MRPCPCLRSRIATCNNDAIVVHGTARILLLAFAMDAIYQVIVLKTFYPGEMAIVAVLLAFIPYILLRGPFARIARWWMARKSAGSTP